MTRTAGLVFAALVVATAGAFVVTQRLKQAPRPVRTLTVTRAISPHVPYKRASIRIRLERADRITVSIIDASGEPVRRLLADREFAPDRKIELLWNGRNDRGRIVPDGEYRIRVGLRRQGRSMVLLDTVQVDGTPPRPVVRVVRAKGEDGPAILPRLRGGPVRFRVSGTRLGTERLFLYRTDGLRPRFVQRLTLRANGAAEGSWDGRVGGRPAPPGPYAIVAKDTDDVGNSGFSYPFTPARRGDPSGGPGVTVRPLAAQAPLEPTLAGRRFTLYVDARGRPWRWRLHRLGQTRTLARGSRRGPVLRLRAPNGPSGLYVVELASGPHRFAALVPVQDPRRRRVLVVVPAISWQGRNLVDDNGDGTVDNLERDGRARLARPLAGGGMPFGFAANEEPLLRLLDRPQQRYDITTDAALAGGRPDAVLRPYRGVVLAGNPQWLTPQLSAALRRFVMRGGRVLSPGTQSLRRTVRLTGQQLSQPSRPSGADAFGATIAPVSRRDVELLVRRDDIGLFRGGDGLFRGFRAFEETLAAGPRGRVVAAAEEQGARAGAPVIVAVRLGRGLVIRTGLPDWERRIAGDANVEALTKRAWALLSG